MSAHAFRSTPRGRECICGMRESWPGARKPCPGAIAVGAAHTKLTDAQRERRNAHERARRAAKEGHRTRQKLAAARFSALADAVGKR